MLFSGEAETFFEKALDKREKIWYNAPVIRRQQVPVKAQRFPAEGMNRILIMGVIGLSSRSVAGERFFCFSHGISQNSQHTSPISHFTTGGENQMPSNSILEKKQQIVADLAAQIKESAAGVIVNYQGITVDTDTAMRKELRTAGVKYVVSKNTLTGRACDEVGYGALKEHLNGMTAIAISKDDPVAAAKILKKYADKVESFNILAGYVDGAVIDANTVGTLADIPSKETLIAKFLGSIRSPLYSFAYALQAVVDKNGEAAPAEAPAEA